MAGIVTTGTATANPVSVDISAPTTPSKSRFGRLLGNIGVQAANVKVLVTGRVSMVPAKSEPMPRLTSQEKLATTQLVNEVDNIFGEPAELRMAPSLVMSEVKQPLAVAPEDEAVLAEIAEMEKEMQAAISVSDPYFPADEAVASTPSKKTERRPIFAPHGYINIPVKRMVNGLLSAVGLGKPAAPAPDLAELDFENLSAPPAAQLTASNTPDEDGI